MIFRNHDLQATEHGVVVITKIDAEVHMLIKDSHSAKQAELILNPEEWEALFGVSQIKPDSSLSQTNDSFLNGLGGLKPE